MKKIFLIFLALSTLWLFFVYKNEVEKNIEYEITANWFNLDTKEIIDKDNIKLSIWDKIERTIVIKNLKFFPIKNLKIKDFDPFLKKEMIFEENVEWNWVKIVKYITEATKISILEEKLFSKKINIQKNLNLKFVKNNNFKKIIRVQKISKVFINNNFDEFVELYWRNINFAKKIIFKCWEKVSYFEISKKEKNKVFVNIWKDSLQKWNCKIWVENNWKNIFYKKEIKIKKEKNNWVLLRFITPNTIKKDLWGYIVMQGKGFKKVKWISLSNWIILNLKDFKIENDKVLILKIPQNLEKWEYFFRFLTNEWFSDNETKKLTII